MGCCQVAKASEDEEIYNSFSKIFREKKYTFSISNYEEIADDLSFLSNNNFKKLIKKQVVRTNFINKCINKIKNDLLSGKYPEDDAVYKLLFHILVSTLILKNSIMENGISVTLQNPNKFEFDLLGLAFTIIKTEFAGINNLRITIYYLARMLTLLCVRTKDTNKFIDINFYVNKIIKCIDGFPAGEDLYYFIRDNIIFLGQYCDINDDLFIEENTKMNLIILYSESIIFNYQFIIENHLLIKKFISSKINSDILENNLNGVNSDNVSNNDTQKISQMQNIINLNKIVHSLYNFICVVGQDTNIGRTIFNNINTEMDKLITAQRTIKFNEILLLLLFGECCIYNNQKMILSLLDYLAEIITNDIKNNNIYYSIIIDSYFLFMKNDILNTHYALIIAQIFMKEIEVMNQENNEIDINNFLISKILQTISNFNVFFNKAIELFFYFIYDISNFSKNKNLDNLLINLSTIIKKYFSYINNKAKKISSTNIISLTNNEYIPIYETKVCEYLYKKKILMDEFETISRNFEGNAKIIYIIDFCLNFMLFIFNYMNCTEMTKEVLNRKKLYYKLFKIITQLESLLIEKECEMTLANDYIITTISIILLILENKKYSEDDIRITDCECLYKAIEYNLQSLLKDAKLKNSDQSSKDINIDFNVVKFIYNIIFFILCQFKRLFRVPTPMEKIHKEIVEFISKLDEQSGKYLSSIEINNYMNKQTLNEKDTYNQYLTDTLVGQNDSEYSINNTTFKQILEIIYSKLFGRDTSLYIFFDNQKKFLVSNGLNINLDYSGFLGISSNSKPGSDVITEGNISMNNGLEDISFMDKNKNDKSIVKSEFSSNNQIEVPDYKNVKENDLLKIETEEDRNIYSNIRI